MVEIDWLPPPQCNEGKLVWIPFSEVLKIPTPKTDWFIYKYILEGTPFAFHATFDEQATPLEMTEEISNETIYKSQDL